MTQLRVLAPLDHSSRDRILLPHLRRLALATGARVHVLHVVPSVKTLTPHAIRSAESYVDAVVGQLQKQSVDAGGVVRKGDPAAEIAKVATEYEVDSIVMGTRGRRGLDRLVLGSVAEDVMNRCATPVTLVNEATASDAIDEKVWAQSSYMAGIIWNRVARGHFTEERAALELQRLEAMGLDSGVLEATYATLKASGTPAEWLDLDFQLDTLHDYLPEALQDDPAA